MYTWYGVYRIFQHWLSICCFQLEFQRAEPFPSNTQWALSNDAIAMRCLWTHIFQGWCRKCAGISFVQKLWLLLGSSMGTREHMLQKFSKVQFRPNDLFHAVLKLHNHIQIYKMLNVQCSQCSNGTLREFQCSIHIYLRSSFCERTNDRSIQFFS